MSLAATIDTPKTSSNALADWKKLYDAELMRVDTLMRSLADERAQLITAVVEHIIAAGGKRIRPILTILSAKLCGYEKGERHVNLAASIEFLHTATLLHDDVVDESVLRRGVDTANVTFGNAASVLVGDFLLARAFQLMAGDGSIEVLKILSDASAVITEGEVKQLMAANDIATSEETYLDIIASKTAQLFAAATRVGAVVANKSQTDEEALTQFGQNLGIAFQLVDDALDYSAKQEALGKTIGDDFREGKVTLPVITAYAKGNKEEKAFWERVIDMPEEQTEADLKQAIQLIHKYKALEEAMGQARHYATKAENALGNFPQGEYRKALLDILWFSVNREF